MITDDKSIANISRLLTFTNITQLLVFIIFCWIELFLGNYNTLYGASIAFYESLIIFITIFSKSFIIELFVIVSVMTYYFSAYLNTISTNYNMLLINIINQLVPIFFLIFPQFNNGIKYPFYIILLSLVFNISSVILWIYGEKYKSTENEYKLYNTFPNNPKKMDFQII